MYGNLNRSKIGIYSKIGILDLFRLPYTIFKPEDGSSEPKRRFF